MIDAALNAFLKKVYTFDLRILVKTVFKNFGFLNFWTQKLLDIIIFRPLFEIFDIKVLGIICIPCYRKRPGDIIQRGMTVFLFWDKH